MKILIIGNGGREHALAWKVAQSNDVKAIYVAPGNGGTATEQKTQNIAIEPTDVQGLLTFALEQSIDLTIVGPEAALAVGIVDRFQKQGLKIFGPSAKAAQLETSKAFCKDFLKTHAIPTARYAIFNDVKPALEYLQQQQFPIVIKASGLAAGKGVLICQDLQEATQGVNAILKENQFGDAGRAIVIEDFLVGEELSFIVMADGEHAIPLASSQDHKQRDDGDQGPNTGGMGAYSPVTRMTPSLQTRIMTEIIEPTIEGLKANGTPFVGFLYAGLMITDTNDPMVLEFNVRLGDPETQPLMMRLKSDLVSLMLQAIDGNLLKANPIWDERSALGVVMTAGGYPNSYQKGDVITGIDTITDPDVKVFHAGTTIKNNALVTNGGRVLTVTALGHNIVDAREKAYRSAAKIDWNNCYYRQDIGNRPQRQPH